MAISVRFEYDYFTFPQHLKTVLRGSNEIHHNARHAGKTKKGTHRINDKCLKLLEH